ncbi:MAG: DPP IV N-terminal domain-containing protein [Bryobacteraceae bacterium]|nr:DPP IV N-terminal domain-containing protein [Bryobacteraceae bacterium]
MRSPRTLLLLTAVALGVNANVWSPAGREYAHVEGGKLLLFDAASRKSKELVEMKKLEATAIEPPPAGRFDWQNRRVGEKSIQWMPNARDLLLVVRGDLFLFDTNSKKWEQLTATPFAERDPKPSPDGKSISYRVAHDLFVRDLASKKETRLTSDGSDNILNGELDWVYPEELDLGTAYWWSPDSKKIAYLQFDTSRLGIYPHADLLGVTPIYEPQKYPKAGTLNSEVRLGVVSTSGGDTVWMNLGETRDRLLARVAWFPEGGTLAVQRLNRVQNRLDVLSVDTGTAVSKTLFTETDAAWINVHDDLRFLPSRREFLWSSEKSGFRHLYRMTYDGKEAGRVTSGEWEVTAVHAVDEKSGKIFFVSTEVSPLERHLFAVNLDGGAAVRLTKQNGTHTIHMSPAADYYFDTHSSIDSPPRTTIHRGDGTEVGVRKEADPKAREDRLPAEIVKVTAPDGTLLYGRLTKPANFDPSRKYPAVVSVYGGPHAQTVTNAWYPAGRNDDLAKKGFVIWQLDNRGSAGRGHAWEAKLYRRFGKQELADQLVGVDHLVKMGFVDPKRIGITGWSYGGYMTLYAMLNAPNTFVAGVSGAPVTDWRHYDTIYTERYLGLPSENPVGYRDSSVVQSAANLKGQLLLVHNFGDDNVLFQNTLQMADALQRAGKRFEMMIYPQKSHGVTGDAAKQLKDTTVSFFERTLGSGR